MFKIYLSSESDTSTLGNCYGYYAGKCYTKEGFYFPVTDDITTGRTKKYKSNIRAAKAAAALLEKCAYVLSYKIEEIKD